MKVSLKSAYVRFNCRCTSINYNFLNVGTPSKQQQRQQQQAVLNPGNIPGLVPSSTPSGVSSPLSGSPSPVLGMPPLPLHPATFAGSATPPTGAMDTGGRGPRARKTLDMDMHQKVEATANLMVLYHSSSRL